MCTSYLIDMNSETCWCLIWNYVSEEIDKKLECLLSGWSMSSPRWFRSKCCRKPRHVWCEPGSTFLCTALPCYEKSGSKQTEVMIQKCFVKQPVHEPCETEGSSEIVTGFMFYFLPKLQIHVSLSDCSYWLTNHSLHICLISSLVLCIKCVKGMYSENAVSVNSSTISRFQFQKCWMYFEGMHYSGISLKSVNQFQLLLKSHKNYDKFMSRPTCISTHTKHDVKRSLESGRAETLHILYHTAYIYFPQNTIYIILFWEMLSIHYWNLIKIVTAIFEKLTILFLEAHLNGPYLWS
jgi:hypothetical protein